MANGQRSITALMVGFLVFLFFLVFLTTMASPYKDDSVPLYINIVVSVLVGGGAYLAAMRMRMAPAKPNAATPPPALKGDSQMICPHCQTKGTVTTRKVRRKAGVSGGKATAALLTGGISLLGTGLSRKETVTEAHCSKCEAVWRF